MKKYLVHYMASISVEAKNEADAKVEAEFICDAECMTITDIEEED